jgi:hypothetical protein
MGIGRGRGRSRGQQRGRLSGEDDDAGEGRCVLVISEPVISKPGRLAVSPRRRPAGLTDEGAAMFGKALQLVPKIKDPAYLVSKVSALSTVAKAQHEAGFEALSAMTFEQAMQAAMALGEPIHRAVLFSQLGREQHQIGRDAEATRALGSALEAARAVNGAPPAHYLLTVLAARIEAGLMAHAGATLAQAVAETSQSIMEGWRRVPLLYLISSVQEEMGRREDAVATYREAPGGRRCGFRYIEYAKQRAGATDLWISWRA